MINRCSEEVLARKREIVESKRAAELVMLRDGYDTTLEHSSEIQEYIKHFKQLGRLGKELYNRGVKRSTKRLGMMLEQWFKPLMIEVN